MVVDWGRSVPEGHLPVFSVRTEKEAKKLIVATCPRATDGGGYYARELVEEQTLENLERFSDRLNEMAQRIGLQYSEAT